MERAVRAIQGLLPSTLPPSLRTTPANLYQVLSRAPGGGAGQRVHQIRWTEKGIRNCYWQVTRTRLKLEGNHGKAWGKLYWRGKQISEQEERIDGSLKYKWSTGPS
ncbi:hypothetical protein DEU56DRAFT_776588 [Suillus clintonianus]|uniref:uncharacterized protein n=1 Tax=Suillus clintonianus TaxID=1904413 RepID=UPI001B884AFD|nr:uncharacterized protein DEU56DRAFT_776588 [Suillus clintonianus]KAG2152860.1 hypothetical protein DEU56DRAFT_776588 [Suillus clintonianus]